jgi:hypothetical protein
MKTVWYGLLLGAVLVTGCVPGTTLPVRSDSKDTAQKTDKPATSRAARPAAGPVTPDQVTDTNAYEKLRVLKEDVERAEDSEP